MANGEAVLAATFRRLAAEGGLERGGRPEKRELIEASDFFDLILRARPGND